MKYRMIALDLDGTLTNSEKVITPRTKEALFRAMEAGITVVLASGRPDYGIAPLAEELELAKRGGYVCAFNGAKIIDWRTKDVVFAQTLPEAALPVIYRVAKEQNLPLLAHEGDHLIAEQPEEEYIQKEAWINRMSVKGIDDFATYVDFPIYKFIGACEGEELAKKEPFVKEALEGICAAYRSCSFFLEIVPYGVDKAESLARLAESLGYTMENVIACGDGMNDKSMIDKAGVGVAMANAEEAVKAVADVVTVSNDEDGVAVFLEKLLDGSWQGEKEITL